MSNAANLARCRAACFLAASLIVVAPAFAQKTGNAAMGVRLARTWCSSCHVVEGSPGIVNGAGAPPFSVLAADPSTTPAKLHAFLNAPRHPPMPDFQLSRQQMDDVVAYIMSLKHK